MPPTDTAVAPAAEQAVVDGLRHLYRAFQKSSVYAPGHPAAIDATLRSTEFLTQACSGESLLVVVRNDRLTVEGAALADETGALRSLAGLFHDLDISALRIQSGVEADEFDGLIQVLGQARREGLRGDAMTQMLTHAGVHRLGVVPREARVGVVPLRAEIDSGTDVWESLESMLIDDEIRSDEVDPEDIAEHVHQEIARHEGAGVGQLRETIQDVSREINTITSERRNHARERLARFVAALNPKLRQDLLRFDSVARDGSLEWMTEVGDVVPETDLLDALQHIDRVGARVPEQLLTLMSKLMRIAKTRPTLASGLQDTMNNWGVAASAMHGGETDLRAALEEVFSRRDRVDCNPVPHQELLDTLSRYEFDAPTTLSLSRYGDPNDALDIRLHAAEIVVRIVALPGGEEYRAGLFHALLGANDTLIQAGMFEPLRDATVAASTYAMLHTEPEQTYRAAQSYLNDFRTRKRVDAILARACSIDPFPLAAVTLLNAGGVVALGPAIDALIEAPSPSAVDALQGYIATHPTTALRVEFTARHDKGWSSWEKIFAVMRRMPAEAVGELIDPLLAHEEFEVRREALLLLHDIDGDRELRLRELRRALSQDSARFGNVAVRCLAGMDGDEPREMLGDYLDGTLGVTPVYDAGLRAAQSLIRLQRPGVERLARSVTTMLRSFDPRRAALTRKIVDLLRREDEPAARQCVDSWRFSPASMVGLFVPRPTSGDSGGTR